jgi:hypothetical protein
MFLYTRVCFLRLSYSKFCHKSNVFSSALRIFAIKQRKFKQKCPIFGSKNRYELFRCIQGGPYTKIITKIIPREYVLNLMTGEGHWEGNL